MSTCIAFKALPRARASDPITSHEAADIAQDLRKDHSMRIIAVLEQHGPLGKDGIASRAGIDGHQVGKRMAELQAAGEIEPTGNTVRSLSGRSEREWRRKVSR